MWSTPHARDFGPFNGKIWLNSASEGALPKIARKALQAAISWKINPTTLTHQHFIDVPAKLKDAIGRLLSVSSEDVILGNSATYGIHLLANGLPFKPDDEILLMRNDFPTDILPWLTLESRGVKVHQWPSRGPVITPEEIVKAITAKTRLICLPHVHTFSGYVLDIAAIGKVCRQRGIIFVVNFSQSAGYIPLNLKKLPIDAMTCAGFKWLCGPYGTGFCWIKKEIRETMCYPQAFWVNVMSPEELAGNGELRFTAQNSAKSFDVFGTANFFNFVPLTASIEYLLKIGIDKVQTLIKERVGAFVEGLDKDSYVLISASEERRRSALIVFSHRDPAKNNMIFRKFLQKGIGIAKWKGNLRIAPHIFNTYSDIEKTLKILESGK